jgi:hypothetical protein
MYVQKSLNIISLIISPRKRFVTQICKVPSFFLMKGLHLHLQALANYLISTNNKETRIKCTSVLCMQTLLMCDLKFCIRYCLDASSADAVYGRK